MRRILVQHGCSPPCPSCTVCRGAGRPTPSVREAVAKVHGPAVVLGGGDATRWPGLAEFLSAMADLPAPPSVHVEAPARSLDEPTVAALVTGGVAGVTVVLDAGEIDPRLGSTVDEATAALERAEAAGLATRARILARPDRLGVLPFVAERLAPRAVRLEIARGAGNDGEDPVDDARLEEVLTAHPNLLFCADRSPGRGYLPPCALPSLWKLRPSVWDEALAPEGRSGPAGPPPARLAVCDACSLGPRCRFDDASALTERVRAELRPVPAVAEGSSAARPGRGGSRAGSAATSRHPRGASGDESPLVCTAPWTTLEVVDPDGRVRQCCGDWTRGDRGNLHDESLAAIWNGAGYRAARRAMGGSSLEALCRSICPRLHDRLFSEDHFEILDGAPDYVRNQLLIAEEIAERREEVRSKPLYVAVCPSTYCNYDCIMCTYGRTPRRDLPESVWGEIEELLPTLRALTLLGGEPLANPAAMGFLRRFDRERYPDASVSLVTNGSLLGRNALRHLGRCTFGSITVSVNAGTPEVYSRVQRGVELHELLANLDALIEFRDSTSWRPFPIVLSFVVQPANAHTLIEFGELARSRSLPVRLMPLGPRGPDGLDYYDDEAEVARILAELDRFAAYARAHRADWLPEIHGTREAIRLEGAARIAGRGPGGGDAPSGRGRALPVVS